MAEFSFFTLVRASFWMLFNYCIYYVWAIARLLYYVWVIARPTPSTLAMVCVKEREVMVESPRCHS